MTQRTNDLIRVIATPLMSFTLGVIASLVMITRDSVSRAEMERSIQSAMTPISEMKTQLATIHDQLTTFIERQAVMEERLARAMTEISEMKRPTQ